MNIQSSIQNAFLIALFLTPVFSLWEIIALFQGNLSNQTSNLTPAYIKILKDLLIVVIFFLSFISYCKRKKIPRLNYIYFIFIIILISIFLTYCDVGMTPAILAGIRWAFPLIFFFAVYHVVDEKFQKRISSILIVLFFCALFLQILEMFFMSHWYGVTSYGLSKRNPGFFLIPSTMALFSSITLYYTVYYCSNKFLRILLIYLLVPLSIFLTGSGTGILILLAISLAFFYQKIKKKFFALLLITNSIPLAIFFLPIISGRSDIFWSLQMRLKVFFSILGFDNFFISNSFGYGTNSAVILSHSLNLGKKAFVADSLFTSLVANIGVVGLLIFLVFLFRLYKPSLRHNQFFIIFLFSMVSSISFEVFPLNYLIMINLVYFMKFESKRKSDSSNYLLNQIYSRKVNV
jgi:hypothetical protein